MSCSTSALDGTGQIVPVEDPAALAEAVDALLADPNWRRQLGLAARQRVVEEFSSALDRGDNQCLAKTRHPPADRAAGQPQTPLPAAWAQKKVS